MNADREARKFALELASRLVSPGPNATEMVLDSAAAFAAFLNGDGENGESDTPTRDEK